jgi:hypothetical protein
MLTTFVVKGARFPADIWEHLFVAPTPQEKRWLRVGLFDRLMEQANVAASEGQTMALVVLAESRFCQGLLEDAATNFSAVSEWFRQTGTETSNGVLLVGPYESDGVFRRGAKCARPL